MNVSVTPFSIGLTGGIGSGKSLVANMFAERGAAIIDTDQIAHQLTMPDGTAIDAIRSAFGADFLSEDGAMNRPKMRQYVFSDRQAKQQLESILHPLILSATEQTAAAARGPYLIFVVPLLVESNRWRQRVSRVLVVDCPEQMQVQRVMQRNGLAEVQVRAIMAAQVPRATRLAAADDIVTNDADPAALVPQIDRLHASYLLRSKPN